MTRQADSNEILKILSRSVKDMLKALDDAKAPLVVQKPDDKVATNFVKRAGRLVVELQQIREVTSPIRLGRIGITLGRSDSIAKFFAFSFLSQEKQRLCELEAKPFYGSGVYAVYYHGGSEAAYQPISKTETPIYVGKADPIDSEAETVEAQGMKLFRRLKEHSKSIGGTELDLGDFYYRAVPIQSGMQAAVEDFMIRLFRPIWNKEVKICYGIGKHGDAATTRANKRSPWDTMHPGRSWAASTRNNQMSRRAITDKIAAHFRGHSPVKDKKDLFNLLALK